MASSKNKQKIYGNTRDFAGNLLQKGDIVAYGQAFGRCAGLNLAVVLDAYQIDTDRSYQGQPTYEARVSIYTNQDTWKPFHERPVIAVTYSGRQEDKNKITCLKFSDRCVAVPPDSLPASPLADHFRFVSNALKTDDKIALQNLGIL